MPRGKEIDHEFRFLLEIDAAFEAWRVLAVEWIATQNHSTQKYGALTAFFVRYLQALQLDKRPVTLFKKDACLPDLWATLSLDRITESNAKAIHDAISDFVDWVLRQKFAETNQEGRNVVPTHLANPFPRRRRRRQIERVDPEFRFLLAIDPAFEAWRVLAVEWLTTQKGPVNRDVALNAFFVRYLQPCQLVKRPAALFEKDARLPDLWSTLDLDGLTQSSAKTLHDAISDFLDWVLREKLAETSLDGRNVVPTHLANPFPRRRRRRQIERGDSEFRFLLAIDPAFEAWRLLVVEWLTTHERPESSYIALSTFFVRYLQTSQLDKRPATLFETNVRVPDLWATLGLDGLTQKRAKARHDEIIDFLEWVLREKFAETDQEGRTVVPAHLANPFLRRRNKRQIGKVDSEYRFLLAIDPAFEAWRVLVVKWLTTQERPEKRYAALNAFLVRYLQVCQLDKRPAALFEKDARLPDLWATLSLDSLTKSNAKAIHDAISDFLDWVLRETFAETGQDGRNVVPAHLANPFPRRETKQQVVKIDAEFRFLLAMDPAFEAWRVLVVEWLTTQKGPKRRYTALAAFLVRYLHACQLDKRPAALFQKHSLLPDLWTTLRLDGQIEDNAKTMHDEISDFLDWVLREKFSEADAQGHNVVPPHLANPFPRRRSRRQVVKVDSEFRFLLAIDPAFEAWRVLLVEWLATQESAKRKYGALTAFFVRYLHASQLDMRPAALFKKDSLLPDLWTTLSLDSLTKSNGKAMHDVISDFLDWVLREKFSEGDGEGHNIVPAHLANPFPRLRLRSTGKAADLYLTHVLDIDPRMESWRSFAAEWLQSQLTSLSSRRGALDTFLVMYIIKQDLPRNPIVFLKRSTSKPVFSKILAESKAQGEIGRLGRWDISLNNRVSDFLDWLLSEKFSVEDDHGQRLIPYELHNPVARLSLSGVTAPTESVRSALSIRYIKELRSLLAEGLNFCDWKWAQKATDGRRGGGDWIVVDRKIINPTDPDCVWRELAERKGERARKSDPAQVCEIWSPVRATALLLKLELPLRTVQVRMLDSGEADTWRYLSRPEGGAFELNDSPLATGNANRPYQRGVFHRHKNDGNVGLFINTNKTADTNKAENARGYVIPWTHETVLYWLEKLRKL